MGVEFNKVPSCSRGWWFIKFPIFLKLFCSVISLFSKKKMIETGKMESQIPTTDMSSWTPAKFCSSRRQILKEVAVTSSSHTVVASCLRRDLYCSAVAKIVGGLEYFPCRNWRKQLVGKNIEIESISLSCRTAYKSKTNERTDETRR